MLLALLQVAVYTAIFGAIDRQLGRRWIRPYYAVHVIHNAIIVALTAGDVVRTFTDLGGTLKAPVTWSAVYLCYALHLYHTLMYWRTFYFDDWLHHGLMIAYALPVGSYVVHAGRLMGFNLFFTTGLPGGISYAALFAQRNGWLTRAQEKAISEPVNLWIRAPGCVAHGALTAALALSEQPARSLETAAALSIAILTAWNGLYFAAQVIRASVSATPGPAEQEYANNRVAADRATNQPTNLNHWPQL